MPMNFSNSTIYEYAGDLTLIGRDPATGLDRTDAAGIYTTGRNVKDNVTNSVSNSEETMNDGNSQYPAATRSTGKISTLAATLNTNDYKLDAFMKGSTYKTETAETQVMPNVPYTIGADATVQLKFGTENAVIAPDSKFPVLVRETTGNDDAYKAVDTAPAASGEYKVDKATGVLTFHADDKGKQVFISAEIAVADTLVIEEPSAAIIPVFKAILSGPVIDFKQGMRYYQTATFDSVQPSGNIDDMPRQKTYGSRVVNFTMTAPRGDKAVITKRTPMGSMTGAELQAAALKMGFKNVDEAAAATTPKVTTTGK